MTTLTIDKKPGVDAKFDSYPSEIAEKLLYLRSLILETANEIETVSQIEETLKWGEPSYLTKKGSTIRINRKKGEPVQYAIYFKCTSKLVPSFRAAFGNIFQYENNRAIVFGMEDDIPLAELKQCIAAALTYHTVKHLPLLGLQSSI